MSRHPELNEYIMSILLSIEEHLYSHKLKTFAVIIMDDDSNTPLEKFIFKFGRYSNLSENDNLDALLKAFLLKINVCDAMLDPIKEGTNVTFSIAIEVSDDLNVELGKNKSSWCIVDQIDVEMHKNIIPLKTIKNDAMQVRIFRLIYSDAIVHRNKRGEIN
jgi:mitotic spindle assembly checkpoint protein MAD2B